MDDVLFSYADQSIPRLKRAVIRTIEVLTGQPHLRRLYEEYRLNSAPEAPFFAEALRRLDVSLDIDAEKLAAIPPTGPLVVVANHPYGVLDGIVAAAIMEQVRGDFRVLTHSALLRVPEVRPYLLPVDFSGTPEATRTNLASRAAAREVLARGGAVVVFPAGAVSTAPDRLGRRPALDAPWQPFTAQLIQRSGATVLPIYFPGQNSRLFQIVSHISLSVRLSLLFKEVRDRIGTSVPVRIGEAIPPEALTGFTDRMELIGHLRERTYALATSS